VRGHGVDVRVKVGGTTDIKGGIMDNVGGCASKGPSDGEERRGAQEDRHVKKKKKNQPETDHGCFYYDYRC
jgi:hypothetical protein